MMVYKIRHWKVRGYQIITTFLAKLKLKIWGGRLGRNVKFFGIPVVYIQYKSNIDIGDNCIFDSSSFVNFRGLNHPCILATRSSSAIIRIGRNCGFSGVSIVSDMGVTIGNNVLCGANVKIGDFDDHPEKYKTNSAPVIIEDNVWIGMNVIILKGVTIGRNSIIGAGSIVTKDVPANVIAAGNPCKVIKPNR